MAECVSIGEQGQHVRWSGKILNPCWERSSKRLLNLKKRGCWVGLQRPTLTVDGSRGLFICATGTVWWWK